MVQSHLGGQALKAAAPFGAPTALSQIFVDSQDALTRPPEGYRHARQPR